MKNTILLRHLTSIAFLVSFLFAVSGWSQTFPESTWTGDLRYRFAKSEEGAADARPYQQLRARLQVAHSINDKTKATLRLATGTSAISTNQTLGDSSEPGFVRRPFGVDLAFAEYQALEGLAVTAGRVPNPFWSPSKTQLVFDSDLTFEGLAVQADQEIGNFRFFANGGSFVIAETYDSGSGTDTVDIGLTGVQLGFKLDMGPYFLTFHLANYHYLNIQDAPITALERNARIDSASQPFNRFRGNRVLASGTPVPTYFLQNKFVLQEAGIELKAKLLAFELTAFADRVENSETSTENIGHEYGFVVKSGRTTLAYSQVEKEADSVVASFTDSDSNGGGTDNRGQRFSVGYQFSGNAQVALNHFFAKRGIASTERDFTLSQLDFQLGF